MHPNHIAVMFAGQGVLDHARSEVSHNSRADPARTALPRCTVRLPARSYAGQLGSLDPSLDRTIYLASLAAYRRVQDAGLTPHVLIGHGFGEIAALVAAGAFSISEGVEIVATRCSALADGATNRYSMATIWGPPRQVRTLLNLFEADGVSLAAENSSHESVIVGPPSALCSAADLAETLDLRFVLLKTNGAPHHPSANEARTIMKSKLRHMVRRRFQKPLFSPLRGRLYQDDDDLIDCLTEQLVKPIRFADAVAQLVHGGVTLIVECGPLRGLAATLDCNGIADTGFCENLLATTTVNSRRAALSVQRTAREVA